MNQIQEYKDIVSIKKELPKEIYIRYLERIIKILIKRNYRIIQIMPFKRQKRSNLKELKMGVKQEE